MLAVGATNPDDTIAAYSNFGPWVDVFAPGGTGTAPPNHFCTGDATSLVYTTTLGGNYGLGCGTSFAAPIVAGTAALLRATGLDNCETANRIVTTTDNGRLNAGRALTTPNLPDPDVDGRSTACDNCPNLYNPGQQNSDPDIFGDACDNCPADYNPDQANSDTDAQGNACDADDDNDSLLDGNDNCQFVWNQSQANTDGDAQGNACDADDDNDSIADTSDNCQVVWNQSQDDNIHPPSPPDNTSPGDACDDPDNDGDVDVADNCPDWHNPTQALPPWSVPGGDPDCDGFTQRLRTPSAPPPRSSAG